MAHIVHTENGRLATDCPAAVVRELVHQATNQSHLVIHVHGGLVSEAKGRQIAARLQPVYESAGAYPIFPVWEGGLLETLSNNLNEVSSERLMRVVLKRVRKFILRKYAQDSAGRSAGMLPPLDTNAEDAQIDRAFDAGNPDLLPGEKDAPADLSGFSESELLAIENELAVDLQLQSEIQAVSNGLLTPADIANQRSASGITGVRSSSTTLMDPEAIEQFIERPDDNSRGILSVAKFVKAIVIITARVLKRRLSNRYHGLHATIVEEILRAFYLANVGGLIWQTMKKDTADCFGGDPEVFGGTTLINAIKSEHSAGRSPDVTLVGHSTGAVYIAHFLDAANAIMPAEWKCNLILLAPAITNDLASSSYVRHRARIRNLRMYTMSDAYEKKDRLVPVLYPHSLLYFVSGVVEPEPDTPLVGMERYFDPARYPAHRFGEVENVRQFFSTFANSQVWSVTNGQPAGLNSTSQAHGDFDEDPMTLQSVKHALANGF